MTPQQPFGTISWMPCLPLAHARDRAIAQAIKGDQLFNQRQFAEALEHYREAIRLLPDHPVFHHKAGYAAWRCDLGGIVERYFLEAIGIDPGFAPAHSMLGQWYRYVSQPRLALHHSAVALSLDPNNPDYIVSRALVLAGTGQEAAAWELIQPLMDDKRVTERIAILYARIAPRIGRIEDAVAWISRHLGNPGTPPQERPELLFALSSLLERLGRYDEAFGHVRTAHQLFHREHDPAAHAAWVENKVHYCTADRMRSLARATLPGSRPVFIVGMPRSGTSLIEQILARHPQVFGAGELEEIGQIASALDAGPLSDPQSLGRFTSDDLNLMAGRYLAAISSLNSTATYVTDKMPLNFLHLDLIGMLFPACHVIHCVRDPLDTCLSCYMTNFTAGSHWAWDLRLLGGYYRQYQRLMEHWRTVPGPPMLEVRYEDIVADLEGQTKRMLGFLDLPWDERCLSFHQSDRPVSTASREQVRKPLYSSSVGRSKHYQAHLGPLIETLGIKEIPVEKTES